MNESMKKIISYFQQLGKIHNRTVDKELIDIYIRVFQDESLTAEQMILALEKSLGKHKFFPKPVDLVEILKPSEHENKGAEFAQHFISLHAEYGTDNMAKHVKEHWGVVGWSIYKQTYTELRNLLNEDVPTFKAQIRNLYNSYAEKQESGTLTYLPFAENVSGEFTAIEQKTVAIDDKSVELGPVKDLSALSKDERQERANYYLDLIRMKVMGTRNG